MIFVNQKGSAGQDTRSSLESGYLHAFDIQPQNHRTISQLRIQLGDTIERDGLDAHVADLVPLFIGTHNMDICMLTAVPEVTWMPESNKLPRMLGYGPVQAWKTFAIEV